MNSARIPAVFWSTDVVDVNGQLVAFALNNLSSEFSAVTDINECGEDGLARVVGFVIEIGAVLWLVDSETLVSSGPTPVASPEVWGWANAINDAGDICGTRSSLAFRILADGTFEELAVRRNFTSTAKDISEPCRNRFQSTPA